MATHYVSPSGSATWANSTNIATPCSILTANQYAIAGDYVYLRGGTYYNYIYPWNSGADASSKITFAAYPLETPTFTVSESGGRWAIKIQGVSWIKVDGIVSSGSGCFFRIGYGACYNEIVNCDFNASSYDYAQGQICWTTSAGTPGTGSNHNWVHDCTFSRYGAVTACSDIGTIRISLNYNDPTEHNTFEDNVFFYGGHDNMDVGGRYNVVRNNIFHNEQAYFVDGGGCENESSNGYFGNRCLLLSNTGENVGTAYHTLIEGNRIGHSGMSPDDNGAHCIENAGCHSLIRGNYLYNAAGLGIEFKTQPAPSPGLTLKSGSWSRVYNNTIYHNGYGDDEIGAGFQGGIMVVGIVLPEYWPWPVDLKIKNNINYDNKYFEIDATEDPTRGEITYDNNYNGNPQFVDADISDPTSLTLPNLTLQSSSPCIRAGANLTQANGAGSGAMLLTVDDAYWFQDGTWGSDLSDVQADWIAIGTVSNVVQISAINYSTGVITLANPMTWADNDPIWLYKNSKGIRVLYGNAPEIGAYVYEGTGASDTELIPAAAAIAHASTTPTLLLPADSTLVVSASSFVALADTFSVISVAGLPWFIKLGPENRESVLPTLNWTAGVHASPPVSSSAFVDKVVLLDGSVRYNHRSYAPKRWTLEWASLSEADALGIRNLIDINEPLHYQNTWINTTWHWVVFKSIQITPLKANRERGDQAFRVVIELEEVL